MNAIAFVGATGTGKTSLVRQMVKNVNKQAMLVFDVNNEWGDIYPYPFNDDIDLFLNRAYKLRNGIILVEDATSFLSTRGRSDLLTKILVGKRHTKNTILLLFHSFEDLPKYIFRKCTHVVIFKTLDSRSKIESIFGNERLTEAWQEVQDNCINHPFFSSKPPPPGVIPPSKIFSIY